MMSSREEVRMLNGKHIWGHNRIRGLSRCSVMINLLNIALTVSALPFDKDSRDLRVLILNFEGEGMSLRNRTLMSSYLYQL